MAIITGKGQRALDFSVVTEVRLGPSGLPVNDVVAGCLDGRLVRTPNGCGHRHDEVAATHECHLVACLKGPPARM